MPRPLARIVYSISGASLFIYMTHLYFGAVTNALLGAKQPILQVIVALAGGVLVHLLWQSVARWRLNRKQCQLTVE